MAKSTKILILVASIVVVAILALLIFLGINASDSKIQPFFQASLIEILTIVTSLVTGIGIAISVAVFNEKNINLRKNKDIYFNILSTLVKDLELLPKPTKFNLQSFWKSSLQLKKKFDSNINIIYSKVKNIGFKNVLCDLKNASKKYFDFIDENFYPNAKINDSVIRDESKERDNFSYKLTLTLCTIY